MDAEAKLKVLAELQIETEMKLQRFIETTNAFIQRVDRGMFQAATILDSHEDRISRLEGNRL